MKNEFYNKSRVIAKMIDVLTEKEVEREINFPTIPYSTKENAEKATIENIKMWINERGNSQHNSILEYVSYLSI